MSTYVPKSTRDDVYRFFFTEGVIACKKDRLGNWTGNLGGKTFTVPCIQVMQLMRSFKSRGLIKEQFAWRHYYWFLNDEGVEYLRKYLHLGVTAVPNSHMPSSHHAEKVAEGRGRGRGRGEGRGRGRGEGRGRGRGRGFGGERSSYRAAAGDNVEARPAEGSFTMSTYVPKSTRDDVYRFFFTEGVIACKKDRLGNWTGNLGGKTFTVPCIQVMQLMRSFKSRGLIKEQFAWRHYYWFLNDEGVEYLRKYLHLGVTAVPNSHMPSSHHAEKVAEGRGRGRGRGEGRGRGRGEGRGRGRGRGFGGERSSYRAAAGDNVEAGPVAG